MSIVRELTERADFLIEPDEHHTIVRSKRIDEVRGGSTQVGQSGRNAPAHVDEQSHVDGALGAEKVCQRLWRSVFQQYEIVARQRGNRLAVSIGNVDEYDCQFYSRSECWCRALRDQRHLLHDDRDAREHGE